MKCGSALHPGGSPSPRGAAFRRGNSLTGILIAVSLVGTLGAIAVLVTPRDLWAGSSGPEPISARLPRHQQVIDMLATLIGHSHRLIAVDAGGAVLLWLEDSVRPGALDLEELGLLSHSGILRTITVSSLESPPDRALRDIGRLLPAESTAAGAPDLLPVVLDDPQFAERWRSFEHVGSRVVAKEISDMRIALRPGARGGAELLEISLTWAEDSSDGADEASVMIDVRGQLISAQE